MISVLGLTLETAKEALENEGFSVFVKEVRSKKGVDGESDRVVRQRLTENGSVELCFAQIKETPVSNQ